MGLFKNKVGRPSNDTLKKRRIIAIVAIFAVVLAVGAGVLYAVNYFTADDEESVVGADKNASVSIFNNIQLKNSSSGWWNDGAHVKKGTYASIKTKTIDIELPSSGKGTVVLRAVSDKSEYQGVKVGKKKYYYTTEVVTYDKNKNIVTKVSKDVKKEKTDISIPVNSSVAYLDINIYSRTDKYLMKTVKFNVLTGVEVKIDNLTATFPDINLRECIKNEIGSSTITDGQIRNLKWLTCGGRGISNTKGIEKFVNLENLWLSDNNISKIDLSKNLNLTDLVLDGNKLTKIDLSKNTKLGDLILSDNRLTKLDLSKNKSLTLLYLGYNQLTQIDLSKNTELRDVTLNNNKISKIDLSKNIRLDEIDVSNNKLTSLDVSKNIMLTDIKAKNNKITSIDLSNNKQLSRIEILEGNPITNKKIKVGNNKNLKIS